METNGKSLMSMDDIGKLSAQIYKSGLFQGMKSESQVATLMMTCQADGLHPIQAMRRYDIIEGKPGLKAAALQADFQKDGGMIEFHKRDRTCCHATFSHKKYGSLTIATTMEEMEKNGITRGQNGIKANWRRSPRQMLHWRCVSEGVLALHPAIAVGIYTVEEIQDFEDEDYIQPTIEVDSEVVDETAVDQKPETTDKEKKAKALRAALNQEYAGCIIYDDIVKINSKYERMWGKDLWGKLTCHNEIETFADIAGSHIYRTKAYEGRHTTEAHTEWIETLKASADVKEFYALLRVYDNDTGYHENPAIHEALRDRAKELAIWDDESQDFIRTMEDSEWEGK